MAEQVIDTLKLEIEANSSKAEESVERLATSLLGLNQSIKKLGNNVGGMRKVFSSLSNLSTLKIPDFGRTLTQLKEMSQIDFKNLENKKLNVELKINGASEAERMQTAIHEATKAVKEDAKVIAKELQGAFNLDANTTKKLQKEFADFGAEVAKGNYGGNQINNILSMLSKNGTVTRDVFDSYFGGIGSTLTNEYKEFVKYVYDHPIKTSEIKDGKNIQESWFASGLGKFQNKKGTVLDEGYFQELIDMFPNVMSGIRQADNELRSLGEDFGSVTGRVVSNSQDMADAIRERLVDALQYLNQGVSPKESMKYLSEKVGQETFGKIFEGVPQKINDSLQQSSNQIQLDLNIDTKRIISQIESAINEARKKNYGTIDVKLEVATDILRNQLKTAFAGFESKDITNIATSLRDISVSFANMSGVNLTGTGATQFFKALSSVNTQNASPTDIGAMINSFAGFASVDMSKYSEGINKFANALVRLSATDTTQFNSELTRFVDAMARFASVDMSGYNQKINNFQNALVRLAKIDTASTFSAEITKFVDAMARFASVDMSGYNEKITNFVNAIKRLAQVDMTKYSASINGFVSTLARLISVDMTGFNEQIIGFVNSITRLMKVGDNATPAENIRQVSDAIISFMNAMSVVDISENTIRMAEALADLSKNSNRAKQSMEDMTQQVSSTGQQFDGVRIVIDSIKDSFGLLGKTLKKLGSITTTAIGGLIGKIKELATHQPKIDNMGYSFKNLLKTVIGFRGLTGVFNWLKESVSLGAEITEIDHIVESVFGEDMVGYVNEWANNAIEKFGIAANSAKKYAGTLSAMFQASNVAMSDSNQMAMKLTELAGDLSAFYNIDTETAYNKIKSGMAGMVRPLRDLGIDLTAASLAEYAHAKGIEKKYSAMSQAEKMMLRYEYLLEQTERQSGDFARQYIA